MNSPTTTNILATEPLSRKSFAPYGRLLKKPSDSADICQEGLKYWHTLSKQGFSQQPVWGFLELYQRDMLFQQMERHCQADEVFIATSGVSLMPFAIGGDLDDPKAAPDLNTLRVFRIPVGMGFIIQRGVWHTVSFPLDQQAQFLLSLDKATPDDDLDIRSIKPHRIIQTVRSEPDFESVKVATNNIKNIEAIIS